MNGSGGYITVTGGEIGSGYWTAEVDYSTLALETDGAVWDLNLLRSGGVTADSFASAFLDIKVEEVVKQIEENTPVVPVPATAWLMVGALRGMRQRDPRA